MKNNEKYFNCTYDDSCNLKIGYALNDVGKHIIIIVSIISIILNIFFFIYNITKLKKRKGRKISMKMVFLIFPIIDSITSVYWLISSIFFYDLNQIQNNQIGCALNSVFYIELITFQFTFINCLIYHFREINKHPIENIFKPKKKILIYILICVFIGAIVNGFSEYNAIIGRSPMNTCFINTKYSGRNGYIFFFLVLLLIIAIIQLIHDLIFVKMFNSDKSIRRIHRKNSCYVFLFCLLHIPFIIIMVSSLILKKNNFSDNIFTLVFIQITTFLTCFIPLIISIIRQLQGSGRCKCINNCVKRRRSKIILSSKTINTNLRNNESSITSDFEWLENHIMEYFMRDILIGVALSLKESNKYDEYSNKYMNIKQEDFNYIEEHKIDLTNYYNYNLGDETISSSPYLDVKVIDYAPKVFSYLRKIENININKMIESFLPKNNSQGIKKSQGKSGSFFISTDDNKYMIKTLKSDELELLKHVFLKEYVKYIENNPNSLLCRLYGMYNIILGQGDEILVIVMRNVIGDFKDNTIVKFDLKGSTYKRKSKFDMGNNNNVMKDLDFNEFEKSIMLSLSSIERLRINSEKDSQFLCKSGLMDYSLFLVKLTLNKEEAKDTFGDNIIEKQNDDFIQITSSNENNQKDLDRNSEYYKGKGAIHDIKHYKKYLFPSLNQGTAYIISIIDYFQLFNFFKYIESNLKTKFLFQKKNKNEISCVDPKSYSDRFIKYINSLTDVKQFLSNEITEAPNDENSSELESEEDSEEEGIFKNERKGILSLKNNHTKNNAMLLLPLENKPEVTKSYVQQSKNLI